MRWWIKLIVTAVLVALLALLGFSLVRGVTHVLKNVDLNAGEADPMFAEPAETIVRPEELDAEEAQPDHPTLDDYVPEVESPVDVSIGELIREAEAAAGQE